MLGSERQVFLVPVPDAGALVVADPGAFLCEPPAAVTRLFAGPADPAPEAPSADVSPLHPERTDG